MELRKRIGERIFELEKVELRSRRGGKTSSSKKSSRTSKHSSASQISLMKIKTMTELAKRKVEMQYARTEAQKQMEMQRKKYEIEEIQRMKSYESAKAEADAAAKIEDEEGNPKLLNLDQFAITKDDKEERTCHYVSSLTTLSSTGSQDPLPFLFEPLAKDVYPDVQTQDSVQDPPGKISSRSVPRVAFTQPFSEPASTENQHRAITEAIAEGMEAARLPMPLLTVFSGDPLGWLTWKFAFETVIEKRATNTNEKMLYLLQYLSGPPKKIVEGYQFVPTGNAYDFYVDDGLKSVPSVKTAIDLIRNTQAMCAKAGLRLHQFSSNKKEVIQAVAPEDRAKGLRELDLACDPLPIERTLGIMWCAESDTFQFRIIIQDRPLTRRGMLSTVCSVYDPLGFVAPLILMGKQI